MPDSYQIPLLVSSNVKVLRWTTLPPDQAAALDIGIFFADANGHFPLPNPDVLGPPGWYLDAFDDTEWTSPVLTDGADPQFEPLQPVFHSPYVGTSQGEPLWAVFPEPDQNASMLVRWRFDAPLFLQGHVASFAEGFNVGFGMNGTLAGYLNLTSVTDITVNPLEVLGGDLISGTVGNNFRLGRIRAGQSNLLAFFFNTYHQYGFGSSLVTSTTQNRGVHTSTFGLATIVFDFQGTGLGRSSVQFVG